MKSSINPDRAFIPMARDPFMDFRNQTKAVEIRNLERFSPKTIYSGRPIELRLGYSGNESIWGVIGQVMIGTLSEVFENWPLEHIEPRFSTIEAAIQDNLSMMNLTPNEQVIAFEILNRTLVQNEKPASRKRR